MPFSICCAMRALTHTALKGTVRVVLASKKGVKTKQRRATGTAPTAKSTMERKTSNSGKRPMAPGKASRQKAARLSAPVSKPTVGDQLEDVRCAVVHVGCFACAVGPCGLRTALGIHGGASQSPVTKSS